MTIFDKFQPLAEARRELEKNASSFFNVVMEEIVSGTESVVNGRRMILAGSNNYLGLSFDADCIEAACQAARQDGTGTTGSRMANGTCTSLARHLRSPTSSTGRSDCWNSCEILSSVVLEFAISCKAVGSINSSNRSVPRIVIHGT